MLLFSAPMLTEMQKLRRITTIWLICVLHRLHPDAKQCCSDSLRVIFHKIAGNFIKLYLDGTYFCFMAPSTRLNISALREICLAAYSENVNIQFTLSDQAPHFRAAIAILKNELDYIIHCMEGNRTTIKENLSLCCQILKMNWLNACRKSYTNLVCRTVIRWKLALQSENCPDVRWMESVTKMMHLHWVKFGQISSRRLCILLLRWNLIIKPTSIKALQP